MPQLSVWAPGKLMLMGEYAVTEPGHTGIVTAVNRGLTCRIEAASHFQLRFPGIYHGSITAPTLSGVLRQLSETPGLALAHQVLKLALRYLVEEGHGDVEPFSVIVRSDLNGANGRKLGLGSSAAFTAALLAALISYGRQAAFSWDLDPFFKLAALVYLTCQPLSSCADLAASIYGGALAYQRFDPKWIQERVSCGQSLHEMVETSWPYLKICRQRLLPAAIRVGWTGMPVSTPDMLERVARYKAAHGDNYALFLSQSEHAVQGFLQAQQPLDLFRSIGQNRAALLELGQAADLPIETPVMKSAVDMVYRLGGAGKASGAGGGDAILAWFESGDSDGKLFREWGTLGVNPIPLLPSDAGITPLL